MGFYSKITTQGRFEEAKYPELAQLFFRTHFRPHNIFRILMIEYYEPTGKRFMNPRGKIKFKDQVVQMDNASPQSSRLWLTSVCDLL